MPPKGVFLPLRLGGVVLGCGGLRTESEGVAEIKRMWVPPKLRGRGAGRALLSSLEEHARRMGFVRVRLDTAAELDEARPMYAKARPGRCTPRPGTWRSPPTTTTPTPRTGSRKTYADQDRSRLRCGCAHRDRRLRPPRFPAADRGPAAGVRRALRRGGPDTRRPGRVLPAPGPVPARLRR
ncbi:GNAT family N-acetyltransferase [Saccharopolyspora mangrovi]|uniref:GNAT family N-acetyltransferase n=1 Tax=Saccharopolyspora mangrovi TaxID=3082379 RepID=A0ABU6AA27_9PSEU|nr:GNAT family N-acetyltransferase [Saccharopolyspora sp. S2-29]MEB3368298.1 GNAT family N-acetyltransferase [Saccharopolyspora sp. S2-29]